MTAKQFLVKISRTLDELKIEYAISGGVAVSVWGRPRYTADLDIIVKIPSVFEAERLTARLLKKFTSAYLDKEMVVEAIKEKSEFNLIEPEYGLKADFFVLKDTEHAMLELKRARQKRIGGKLIKFISPEDLIISKLRWYQISESDRQLEDILTVLEGTKIDKKYLNLWVKKLGLEKEYLELKKKNPRGLPRG